MDALVERKFHNLRRRLDQLGFHQPMGLDSLPLVERLFSDLITTTDSLKTATVGGGCSTTRAGRALTDSH